MGVETILIIILIVLLIGAIPAWPHSADWGYPPAGLILLVIIVLLLFGCARDPYVASNPRSMANLEIENR